MLSFRKALSLMVAGARARFNRVHSEHIYSLSPSPLHDAGLICSSSSQTYEADAKVSAEASILLGRIVGPHVHVGKVNPSNVASSSKSQAVPPRKPGLKKEEKVLTPEPKLKRTNTSDPVKKEVKEEEVLPEKPTKTTGKLDWSKAKPKGTKEGKSSKTEEKKMKEEAMDTDIAEETEKKLSVAKGKDVAKNGPNTLAPEQPKRGTKRKSALQMDSDSESEGKPLPLAKPPIRGSKRKSAQDSDAESGDDSAHRKPAVPTKGKGKKVIVSDDEEEEEAPSKPKYRSKQAATKPSARMKKQEEVPQSLKAMFDVDDDQVIQGSSRPTDKRPSTEPDSQPQDEDVEMTVEDDDPVVKKGPPKKKKEKKVVPVGRNGLKKRRIVKQKTFVDDGGYMVTEDYSSYESVGEEEPEEPKSKRGAKSKKATESPEDPKPAKASLKEPRKANTAKSSDTSSAKKASGSKLSAKGSIQTFFTKK